MFRTRWSDATSRYLSLVTTNGQLRLEEETERERTYSCSYLDADGRGQELALQFSTALFLARAREGTGRPVMPAHVAFAQPAPRSHRWDHPTTQATADRTPV
jgi:hypothetical protein